MLYRRHIKLLLRYGTRHLNPLGKHVWVLEMSELQQLVCLISAGFISSRTFLRNMKSFLLKNIYRNEKVSVYKFGCLNLLPKTVDVGKMRQYQNHSDRITRKHTKTFPANSAEQLDLALFTLSFMCVMEAKEWIPQDTKKKGYHVLTDCWVLQVSTNLGRSYLIGPVSFFACVVDPARDELHARLSCVLHQGTPLQPVCFKFRPAPSTRAVQRDIMVCV